MPKWCPRNIGICLNLELSRLSHTYRSVLDQVSFQLRYQTLFQAGDHRTVWSQPDHWLMEQAKLMTATIDSFFASFCVHFHEPVLILQSMFVLKFTFLIHGLEWVTSLVWPKKSMVSTIVPAFNGYIRSCRVLTTEKCKSGSKNLGNYNKWAGNQVSKRMNSGN